MLLRHFKRTVNPEDIPWITQELKKISEILKDSSGLKEAYKKYGWKKDEEKNTINIKGFCKMLRELCLLEYDDFQRHKLFSFLETAQTSFINFEDFESILFGRDFFAQRLKSQEIWAYLYANRLTLRDVFRQLDNVASGSIDIAEFKAALEAFNEVTSTPLTEEQINALANEAVKDEDGCIDYAAFLSSFKVVDF